MKLVAESGTWTAGPPVAGAPAVAVLEVSGAVLAWTVDDPAGAARITVTDVVAADWLWRVVGSAGHAALVTAIDLAEVELRPDVVAVLRRLAIGHWLRRWWPESARDGIARLDRALLDGELAVLVAAAQEYFSEDTPDFDVGELLGRHRAALCALELDGDPRIGELVRACAELAEESGAWSDQPGLPASTRRRDHYALAAGRGERRTPDAIANGAASVNWLAVPPGIFDAADGTIDWTVQTADSAVVAGIAVATTGDLTARGVEVRLRSGIACAAGVLDANATAVVELLGPGGQPLTESEAWNHDWSTTVVSVGADVPAAGDAAALRRRIRDYARGRLAHPGPDAFLAEIIAAEADY